MKISKIIIFPEKSMFIISWRIARNQLASLHCILDTILEKIYARYIKNNTECINVVIVASLINLVSVLISCIADLRIASFIGEVGEQINKVFYRRCSYVKMIIHKLI